MADSLIEKINAGGATYVVHDANAVPNTRKINDVVLNTDITLSGDDVKLTGYTKGSSTAAVAATDKINEAIAKHENRIDTNQSNILLVQDATKELVDKGAKNLVDFSNLVSLVTQHTTVTKTDTTITVSSTDTWGYQSYLLNLPAGKYELSFNATAVSISSGTMFIAVFPGQTATGQLVRVDVTSIGAKHGSFEWTGGELNISFYANPSNTQIINSMTITDVMLCTEADWKISQNYTPFVLPNYDLTYLQAEDRAALVDAVDAGAKNKLKLDKDTIKSLNSGGSWSGYVYTPTTAPNLTVTINDDSTVTLNGSTSSSLVTVALERKASSGFQGYVLSGSKANTKLVYQLAVSPYTVYATVDGADSAVIANYTDGSTIQLSLQIVANSTFSNTVITPMICTEADWKVSQKFAPFALPNTDLTRMMTPFFTVPINHNMIYRGANLGDTLTADQDTALSSGNFTDLYLGDYWTKQITIPAFYEVTTAEPADWSTNYTSYYTKSGDTYTPVSGDTAPTWAANTYYERLVPAQTVTLKAVIADFDTFYAGYTSTYAGINTHHAAVIVTGFSNVVWNKTTSTAGGYVASLIHKWLVGSVLPQMETWFGSAKVLSHQKLLTNAITGDAASGWAWSSQKISLLSECQLYGMKVWGGSKGTNGAYEPGEAFKKLDVFNHIDANLLFGNKNIWLRDIASAEWAAHLGNYGRAFSDDASHTWIAPAALILLS